MFFNESSLYGRGSGQKENLTISIRPVWIRLILIVKLHYVYWVSNKLCGIIVLIKKVYAKITARVSKDSVETGLPV